MVKYLVEPEPYPIPVHGDITWGMIMISTRLQTSEERGAPEPCAGGMGTVPGGTRGCWGWGPHGREERPGETQRLRAGRSICAALAAASGRAGAS